MITTERETTSKLVALDEESRILGYTQTHCPRRFLRELTGSSKRSHQVRIYEVCPLMIGDTDRYYDFEATCLLRREPGQDSQE